MPFGSANHGAEPNFGSANRRRVSLISNVIELVQNGDVYEKDNTQKECSAPTIRVIIIKLYPCECMGHMFFFNNDNALLADTCSRVLDYAFMSTNFRSGRVPSIS